MNLESIIDNTPADLTIMGHAHMAAHYTDARIDSRAPDADLDTRARACHRAARIADACDREGFYLDEIALDTDALNIVLTRQDRTICPACDTALTATGGCPSCGTPSHGAR